MITNKKMNHLKWKIAVYLIWKYVFKHNKYLNINMDFMTSYFAISSRNLFKNYFSEHVYPTVTTIVYPVTYIFLYTKKWLLLTFLIISQFIYMHFYNHKAHTLTCTHSFFICNLTNCFSIT